MQKIIAKSGVASRREAEQWIAAGRVSVNGSVVTEAGTKADSVTDKITVDGEPLPSKASLFYYAFHKPRNVLVARNDPGDRPLIYDYLKELPTLLHPVGRLDFDSEGLLLLTNDGELQHQLTHPSSEVSKIYHVKIKGLIDKKKLTELLEGVSLEDGPARAVSAQIIKQNPHNCWLEIAVTEGRNRIVRRLCEAVGHTVLRLVRVAIGSLAVDGIEPGKYRVLTATEVANLKNLVKA